uniref:(northern house mosquito) hypothetical protein n=1 Tax=Culex pipiens TaxID=7175 RepID=A0A8D8ETY4_CULPI
MFAINAWQHAQRIGIGQRRQSRLQDLRGNQIRCAAQHSPDCAHHPGQGGLDQRYFAVLGQHSHAFAVVPRDRRVLRRIHLCRTPSIASRSAPVQGRRGHSVFANLELVQAAPSALRDPGPATPATDGSALPVD